MTPQIVDLDVRPEWKKWRSPNILTLIPVHAVREAMICDLRQSRCTSFKPARQLIRLVHIAGWLNAYT